MFFKHALEWNIIESRKNVKNVRNNRETGNYSRPVPDYGGGTGDSGRQDGSGKGAVFERAEVCDGCGKAAGAGKID